MAAHTNSTRWLTYAWGLWDRRGRPSEKTSYSTVKSDEDDEDLQASPPNMKNSFRWPSLFSLAIFALNFVGIVTIVALLMERGRAGAYEKTTVFPAKQYETRVFSPQDLYPTPETDALWDADLPKARGFTYIEDPERFDLPAGSPFDGGFKRYGVSWAHQYHCIRMLRDEFWAQLENRSDLVGLQVDMTKGTFTSDERRLLHKAHCYDYLRQVIVCHMDMTLEHPFDEAAKGTIDGYGVVHQCARRELLDEYMIKHAPEGYVTEPIQHHHHDR